MFSNENFSPFLRLFGLFGWRFCAEWARGGEGGQADKRGPVRTSVSVDESGQEKVRE